MKILNRIANGLLAGILISIGGSVYLACDGEAPIGKYVGALLFSVALLCICMKGYSLYTGKICYIFDDPTRENLSVLLLGLLGNTIATILCGLAVRYAIPNIGAMAETVCAAKLGQEWWQTLIRGIFCGMLVYLSVAIYREHKSVVGIIVCIPTFILSGFEHSIADIFYFGASGMVSVKAFVFIIIVIVGNSVGGLALPWLKRIGEKKKDE